MSRFILGLLAIGLDNEASQHRLLQRSGNRFASIVETIAEDLGADLPDGGIYGENDEAEAREEASCGADIENL